MSIENLIFLNIDFEYSVIKLTTEIPAIKYAFKKLLCSEIETNNTSTIEQTGGSMESKYLGKIWRSQYSGIRKIAITSIIKV